MKPKVFLSLLALINVYFFYVCQPVLADASSVKSCASLFNEVTRVSSPKRTIPLSELSKDHEERVYAVHITKYLPSNGVIKVVVKGRGRFIPTLHFSLGEPVVDHLSGKWSEKPYAVVTPLKSLRNQVLNLFPQDTYILGDFKLPKDAVLFIPKGEALPHGLDSRIIQYDSATGIKSAISKFLSESGSIEFKSEVHKWFGAKKTKVGGTNLSEKRNLEKFFLQLFRDKPFLTKTIHDNTVWGRTDTLVIEYLVNWILGISSPSRVETNLTLGVLALRDNIVEMNRIVSQMNLPDSALRSYRQGLQELESYINILEVESLVRKSGHSLLAVSPNKDNYIYSQALSLRYNRKKLFDLVLSAKEQLPKPFEIPLATPIDYLFNLKSASMEEFLHLLKENFPNPDIKTKQELHGVITRRAFNFLLNGKITAEQAFPYFRRNAEALAANYLHINVFDNVLYAVAGETNSLNGKRHKLAFPHRELLRFLKNPWVHQFLESRESFKYLSPESMKTYLDKINSVQDFKIEIIDGFSTVGDTYGLKGDLISVGKVGDGYTRGVWYLDENSTLWFVKKDVHYNELQTSAEVISSNIYRLFGYDTPETVKLIKNGVHYVAVKNVGENNRRTDFSNINTAKVRQMRIVAAYLKDWDRMANPDNNLLKPDGSFTLLDFGGTLGARARGMHKPGSVFSEAIGSFPATKNIDVIFNTYNVEAGREHPWNNLTQSDVQGVVAKFRKLTDEKIESIVDQAGYSNPADRNYMIQALKIRRDGIIRNMPNITMAKP